MVARIAGPLLALAVLGFPTMASVAMAGDEPVPAGWIRRSIPAPGDREWDCANWSRDEWVVAAAEQLTISRSDPRRSLATLPFEPQPPLGKLKKDVGRPSVVRAVPGGYLVGYDRGEFGGGLYWFSADGRKHVELAPPARAKAAWFPRNVHAIAEQGGNFFVFQGLSHVFSRLGRVLKVRPKDGGWQVSVLVSLDVAPEAVVEDQPGSWLVAATDGVSRVTASGAVERLWGRPEVLVGVYPNSIARSKDGSVYVGMRAWVLRLVRAQPEGHWRAEFLAPATCARLVPHLGPWDRIQNCSCAGS